MWATTQGMGLNVMDQQGESVSSQDPEWIRTALLYLQEDAVIWAAPAMEEFADEFKARFETVDKAIDAKDKLQHLWQGTSTVPEYVALKMS